jgi:hypothetical protein
LNGIPFGHSSPATVAGIEGNLPAQLPKQRKQSPFLTQHEDMIRPRTDNALVSLDPKLTRLVHRCQLGECRMNQLPGAQASFLIWDAAKIDSFLRRFAQYSADCSPAFDIH